MSNSITLVCERFFCSYCGGKEQATVQLCVEAWPHDSTIICLSCLLKAVGLLETELEAESETIEVEEFYGVPEGLLSPPVAAE